MTDYLDYEINKELGECYLFMGDYEKAETYYREALDNTSEFIDPYMGLATIAVQNNELDKAQVLYEKALTIEKNTKVYTGLGLVSRARDEHAKAFEYFAKAVENNPANMVALNCLVQEGFLIQRLEEVVEILTSSYNATQHLEIRVTLAGCLISIGRKDEARTHLKEILATAPDHSDAKDLYSHIAA